MAEPLAGWREPRIRVRPPRVASRAGECADLYALTGQELDPWQRDLLDDALGVDAAGRWVAFDVGWMVSRQNGKGGALEARMLAGLYLWDERLQVYTAHQFRTSLETFLRMRDLITNTDVLRRRVRRVVTANGEEGVELLSGHRLRFLARSGGSGRGFTGVTTYLDEGMLIDPGVVGALVPTMSAMPNPQLYTAGSAGPPVGKPKELSREFARLRRRALAAEGGIAYAEWSAVVCGPKCPPECDQHDRREDRRTWAKTNPGLGIVRRNGSGLTLEAVEREWAKFGGTVEFDRERIGVGDWPEEDEEGTWTVISAQAWGARANPIAERPPGAVAIGLAAASPDGEVGSIGLAGRLGGELAVQVVDHLPGMSWMVDRVAELVGRWPVCAVVLHPGGPTDRLIPGLETAGVEVVLLSVREAGQAFGLFTGAVSGDGVGLRHYDQDVLNAAVRAARRKPVGDGWGWLRRGLVDISPVEAVTWAVHGLATREPVEYDVADSFG